MKKPVLFFVVCFQLAVSFGQTSEMTLHNQILELLETVYEGSDAVDIEQLMAELIYQTEHPIQINEAQFDDFGTLFFLNPQQIAALLKYRDSYGPIYSAYELATVDGFSPDLAQLTSLFVDYSTEPKPHKTSVRQVVLLRGSRLLEEQAGFKNGSFEGSPNKFYMRYRLDSRALQLGFVGEKDAGESFFSGSNSKGFDYNSAFARLQFGKKGNSMLLGDYVVQWGQGLAIWQGFAMGKSTDVDRISKFNPGIKAYSSTDENNHMRGVGINLHFGKFKLQPFVSYKKIDANTDSVSGDRVFTSLQTTGLHRTASEIEDRESVALLSGGLHLGFTAGRLQFGVSGVSSRFNLPLERADDLYNKFLFEGNRVSNLAVDYRYAFNRVYVFGETAGSKGGLATLNGLMFQPVGQVSFSVLYRNISKGYNSLYASAFAENSRVNDEAGLFLGLRLIPDAGLVVNAYADFFEYKWIKYTTASPGKGHEMMLRADYKLSQAWQVYGRYFYESKPVKVSADVIRYNEEQVRQSSRMQLNGQLSESILVRTRFERSFYRHDHRSTGWMISQDLGWQTKNDASRVWLRFAWFDTDDYDSRIYAYENDLLYQFSIPAYYGDGIRAYVNGKVKICEKIDCWIKCSRTWYRGVDTLGSGTSAIDEPNRTEVKLQLRFKI